MGLSPEQVERLFTPFERLGTVKQKGHGLGLSIVQRIIEKMSGFVKAESVVGEGSQFSFILPFATDGHPSEAAVSAVSSESEIAGN